MAAVILTLRFLSEIAVLVAGVVIGVGVADGFVAVVLAIALPVIAAAAWGRFVAPASSHRLADPERGLVELVIFGAAVVGLAFAGHFVFAILLAVVALVTAPATRRYESSARPGP